jgi:hypothetical protein
MISSGQQLVTHTAQGRCRLGFVVEASDGTLVGLTARHILDREWDGGIFDAQSSRPLGRRVEGREPLRDGDGFFETIGAFALDGHACTPSHLDLQAFAMPIAAPAIAMGSAALKITGEAEGVPGVFQGFGGSVNFINPVTDEPTLLRDVIEASFGAEDEPAPRGEAGALVTTFAGEAIGLLIAQDGWRSYVAPLEPFLKKYGYHRIGYDLTANIAGAADPDEELAWDLRIATVGAEQLRQDIFAENQAASDPAERHVSRRHLDLLDAG